MSDKSVLFGEKESCRSLGFEATQGMFESIQNFKHKDNVEALVTMGVAWRSAFNDNQRTDSRDANHQRQSQ